MYQALVSRITLRPHPNADKLQIGVCAGNQVIVGLDTKGGDLGVFFPPDGQLNYEFAKTHKLLKEDGGYVDTNRRVRAIKLRGERSEGIWLPMSALGSPWDKLRDGSVIEDERLAVKYETPATKRAQLQQARIARPANRWFPKHRDTQQLRYFINNIPPGAHIIITEKLHGTSGRYALVRDPQPRTWLDKLLRRTRAPYNFLVGSRNVVLSKHPEMGYYGSEQFRTDAVRGLELAKGEIVYGELVGYTDTGGLIMPAHSVDRTKLAGVYEQFGSTMKYTYGCLPGTCQFYIYAISRVLEDGTIWELPWYAVEARAHELGFPLVPEIASFINNEHGFTLSDAILEKPSKLDSSHIAEGVVVRVESKWGIQYYKQKSFTFQVLEGIAKDDERYVDPEEAA